MRTTLALMAAFCLTGCAGGGTFLAHASWPFGNPNAPPVVSETGARAVGKHPAITPLATQAGDVWPGPVKQMPTLSEVEANSNRPLGQAFMPSLPSPYPPGQGPQVNGAEGVTAGGPLYDQQGGQPMIPPAAPGDAR